MGAIHTRPKPWREIEKRSSSGANTAKSSIDDDDDDGGGDDVDMVDL